MIAPRRTCVLLALTLMAGGCGQGAASSEISSSGTTAVAAAAPPVHHARRHRRRARPRRPTLRRPGRLVVSTASADVVQPQPPPGSCHARGSGAYSEPDQSCTPGAINPAVTQSTIGQTICVSGWTATVRPPESITEREKEASMAAYGDTDSAHEYEYDHLVSLELGGAVNDPRNLWPEPGGSPNPKDSVEDTLHRLVCDGQMPLATAQHIIASDWAGWARSHRPSAPAPAPAPSAPATPAPSTSSGPDKPIADVNCSDFPTHAAAQRWFEQHGGSPSNDVAGLDHDHDGLACESLP